MLKQKVTLFFRKPNEGNYSIENVFQFLKPYFTNSISFYTSVNYSKGLMNRIRIAIEEKRCNTEFVHITGDVTFANLLIKKK